MTAKLEFDEAQTRRIEREYQTPDIEARREAVIHALSPRSGEDVLDIGCGPGFLAAELAQRVGPAGSVAGIDISESMLDLARRRCAELANVTIQHGDASDLAYVDASFDAVASVQVYEYLDNVDGALMELHRVLKPGGRAAIVTSDWDTILWHSSDADRMRRVLAAWREHLIDPRLPRTLTARLRAAGFDVTARSIIQQFNPEYHEETYSAGILDLIVDFAPGRRGLSRAEVQAWADDLHRLGDEGAYFFCLNQYLFLASKLA